MADSILRTTMPFDGASTLRYLAAHAVRGVEHADHVSYRRLVRVGDDRVAELELSLAGLDGIRCSTDEPTLVSRARHVFDLDADSEAIDGTLARDPALAASVAANPGLRLPGSLDAHEELFRTLIGQQVSIAAASTVLARIARGLCGDTGLFPTATQLADRGLDVLRGPAVRIAAIHGVAVALASGDLVIDASLTLDELTERLLAMPGIGPWTAGYVAMRVLGSPDVLLSTDLVMLKGAAALGLPATARGLADHARRWSPWRSYAGLHLWRAAATAQRPGPTVSSVPSVPSGAQ